MKGATILLLVGAFALATADFRDDALKATNTYRAKHGAGPLTRDAEADKVAQAYADNLARLNKFEHSGNGKYGENLAGYWGPTKTQTQSVLDAVNGWYGEVKDYNFDKPDFSSKTGHFTALVWKGTKAQGIGIATNPKTRYTVVVANYSPPGNYMGQFADNVGRPAAAG